VKETAIAMFVMLFGLVAVALWQGTDTFMLGVRTSSNQFLRFLPVLVIAMFLAGFMETLIPQEFVTNWLSDASGWRGIGIGWLAGILTPGGSIVGMPLVFVLFEAGVGISVLVTYMTSMALLSVMRMPIEIGFYGWRLMLLRVAASFFLPPLTGLLAQVISPVFIARG